MRHASKMGSAFVFTGCLAVFLLIFVFPLPCWAMQIQLDGPKDRSLLHVMTKRQDGSGYTIMLESLINDRVLANANPVSMNPEHRQQTITVIISEDFILDGVTAKSSLSEAEILALPPADRPQIGASQQALANGQTKITWQVDYALPIQAHRLLFPGGPKLPIGGFNYLLIHVRPKAFRGGLLAPISAAFQDYRFQGSDGPESIRLQFFNLALALPAPDLPRLALGFYADPEAKQPLSHSDGQTPIYVHYEISNLGMSPFPAGLFFRQDLALQDLQIQGGPFLAAHLAPHEPLSLPAIPAQSSLRLWGLLDPASLSPGVIMHRAVIDHSFQLIDVGHFDESMIYGRPGYVPLRPEEHWGDIHHIPSFPPGLRYTYGVKRQVTPLDVSAEAVLRYQPLEAGPSFIPSPHLGARPSLQAVPSPPELPRTGMLHRRLLSFLLLSLGARLLQRGRA